MAFISKEIPTGAIDGVNKVYTLANPISQLDDVWYDGAITPNVTVTGTSEITLTYAPTTSIFVDYYDTPATNPPTGFLLVSELRDIFERYKDDDLPDVSDDVFIDFANDLNLDYYDKYTEINPGDYILSTTFTTTSINHTQALPTDIQNIESVYTLDDDGLQQELLASIHLRDDYGYYYEDGDIIVKGFLNKTIEVRYLSEPVGLSTTTEATLIANKRRNYPMIRNLLNMLYSGWTGKSDNEEVRSSEKYQQDLAKLVLKTSKDSTNPDLNYDIY